MHKTLVATSIMFTLVSSSTEQGIVNMRSLTFLHHAFYLSDTFYDLFFKKRTEDKDNANIEVVTCGHVQPDWDVRALDKGAKHWTKVC